MIRNLYGISLSTAMITLILFLPGCNHKPASRTETSPQKIESAFFKIEAQHAEAISIIEDINSLDQLAIKQQLKEFLLIHNESFNKRTTNKLIPPSDSDFPYLQYKKLIDVDIRRLNRFLKRIHLKSKENKARAWEARINNLVRQLEKLNKTIITTDEYHNEKIRRANGKSNFLVSLATDGLVSVGKKIIFSGLL